LITYRDALLLAPGGRNTPEHRRDLRSTIAHELAHQWFGNLVTQRWWNDVWLSEGFATWLGMKISDFEFAETERGVVAVESRMGIMAADNRPVRLEMRSRKDMEKVYGRIVYQKGAAILGMVERWLGAEAFRRGLQRYLAAHANGSATTEDLVKALNAETGVDVAPVFESYLNQPGFPVLHVAMDCAQGRAMVRQESPLRWNTPVCVGAGCVLVKGAVGAAPLDRCPDWPNADGAGYFRVESDALAPMLKAGLETLTAPERLSIVGDLEALPKARQIEVLPALIRDRDAHVAAAAARLALRLAGGGEVNRDAIRRMVRLR
jgi:cytosol alanyl aminopeptidase